MTTPAQPSTPPLARRKVAYLTGEYPKASHTFILREIEALRAQGMEVLPCSIRKVPESELIGPPERAAMEETFQVLQTAKSPAALLAAHAKLFGKGPGRYFQTLGLALRAGRPGPRGLLWQVFYFLEAGVLAARMSEDKITHLHNHFADSSANVALLAAALADIPFSYTLHGPAELYEPQSWRLDLKTARAKYVACISHFARSQAMLFSDPAHWNKIKIIHCGVRPAMYGSDAEKTDSKSAHDGMCNLVFVGRLTAIKGVRVLMTAFARAHAENPNLTLTLIGDGEERATMEQAAQPLGGAVRFLGYCAQDKVAETLRGSDALVLPSFAEGVPVVLMEAMASGLPVIATQVGGISELVEDRVSGRILAPGDEDGLVAAMLDLASDPARRAEMGAAGRAKVVAEFDIDQEGRRMATLIASDDIAAVSLRPEEALICAD